MQTDIILQLRPRTVGELVDGAFRIYRRNFRTFLFIVAVVYLPVRLLSYSVDVFLLGSYSSPGFSASLSGSLAATGVASQISMLKTYLETFLEYFAQWALTVAVASALLDRPISFGEAYGEVARRFRDVLGLIGLQIFIASGFFLPLVLSLAALLSSSSSSLSSIAALSSCLSLFPLIYAIIQIRLQVIIPAAVNEELAPREALRRTWELTRNYWWRTFALSLVLGILNSIVTLGPGAVIVWLVSLVVKVDYTTNLAITQLIGILTTTLYVPVEIGAIALYYFDQRVRKEGFDLDTAIAQRYESGEGEEDWYNYNPDEYGAPTMPMPPPDMQTSPYGTVEPIVAGSVRQDRDLYPLLASGQSARAMSTFTRRTTAPTTRNMRWISVRKSKRKTDQHDAYPDAEARQ